MNIGTSLNSRIKIVINARHTEGHLNNIIIITNNIQLLVIKFYSHYVTLNISGLKSQTPAKNSCLHYNGQNLLGSIFRNRMVSF
jgi:hypothetical protein